MQESPVIKAQYEVQKSPFQLVKELRGRDATQKSAQSFAAC